MYLGCRFYPFVYVEFSRIPLEKNGLHIFPCTINCQTRVIWTHKRECVIRPGKLYRLFVQGFAYPLASNKLPQIARTGSSDDCTEEKRASKKSFSCKSASAEGKNGNTDFTPAAYRITSQLPFRKSRMLRALAA